ncbi:hypothetical protein ACWCV5_35285 [Streptomyces tubercidicus]
MKMAAQRSNAVMRRQGARGAATVAAQQVLHAAIPGQELLALPFHGVAAATQRAFSELPV